MSYNPCRGSGIGFNEALRLSYKYRELYVLQSLVTFKSLYKKSKYLYYWWKNENKISKRAITELMNDHELEIFKANLSKLFPKLVNVLKDSGVAA
jgi:hypothetical protein